MREHVWHMPHGITLLATPKNGNNYYLLFKQPSSRRFHSTFCVSSSICYSSITSVPVPSALAATLTKLTGSAFLHLASHPKIQAQGFMPEFNFWLGIALEQLAHLTKGANTSSRVLYFSPRSEGTNAYYYYYY